MPSAHSEALIEAPIALVWRVMLDLADYPAWNPFVVQIDCAAAEPGLGSELVLHVCFRSGKRTRVAERITRLEPPSAAGAALLEYEFQGPLSTLYLVRARREQALEALPEGKTRYRTKERLRGLVAWAAPMAEVRDGFERHARALKQRAESLHAGGARG